MVHYALSEEFRSEFNFMCLDTLIPHAKPGDVVVPPFTGEELQAEALHWLSMFTHWAVQQGLSADHTVLMASTHVKYVLTSYQVSTWSDFIHDFFNYYHLEGDVRFAQWYWRRAANVQVIWFSYRELRACTNNFSELKLVSSGKVGRVYQGFMFDDQKVAVKKYKDVKGHSLGEVLYEVFLHRSLPKSQNLVRLIGFSSYEQDPLLVYEYVPGGNLEQHLQGKVGGEKLTWDQRLTIAIDVASAVTQLHYNSKFPIYHRDVKSSNILLDNHKRAKLADFGIAAAVSHEKQRTHCHTKVKGSRGYTDPAYESSGKLTDTTDVYSFGVVLMELVTGLRAGEPSRSKTFLPDLVNEMSCLGLLEEIVDQAIWCPCSEDPRNQCKDCLRAFVEEVVELALKCCGKEPTKRPNINEVNEKLKSIQLEQKMGKVKISERSDRDSRERSRRIRH
ncbi:protein MpRLK-Pelle_WAK_LRK10L-7 [Marchantia polymorpha subsp. ruderalis]|nr:hypothetical protein MARPO_0049s0006 [Marchantia polymorpha]BBN06340.1 hypothetical protein Mp_3g20270 [Marchantia polymorpha subsp. ruderalis]|eukprot:PTQ38701.1 hypothetical protein MARPO_0049s0006 [Marchantia polymorpha]